MRPTGAPGSGKRGIGIGHLLDRPALERILALDFLDRADNVILVGAQGLGKTMLARDIVHQVILAGYSDGGRQPGMFFAVHSIAVDSMGNIYTTETYEGSRLQRFMFRGYAPVPADAMGLNSQGVLWPSN